MTRTAVLRSAGDGALYSHFFEFAPTGHVAAQVIQLGNGHVAFEFPSGCQSGLELQAALQRVGGLSCFDLHKLAGDLKALGLLD